MKRKTAKTPQGLRIVAACQARNLWAAVKKVEKLKAKSFRFPIPAVLAVLVVAILAGLGFLLREQIVVATVNSRPVFRYELNQRMTSSFGKEVLETLIMEKLIAQEAKSKKVIVGEGEIDAEVKKLSQSLGEGANIEEILKYQGMTMADLRQQLKIRLVTEKILQGELNVSDQEIDEFMKNDAGSLTASDEAGRRAEAKGILVDQKINEKFQEWMGELFTKAKISRFLK